MNVDLKGFKVLVTGGSSGLGFEMSKALLSHGAAVAIAARPGEKLEQAYETLSGAGYDAVKLPMDVRSEKSVGEAAKKLEECWGSLDMLVNNAGIGMSTADPGFAVKPRPFFEIPVKAFYDIVETNFIGYFLAARAFVPLMQKSGKGRIVNVSTSIPTMTARGQLPYGPARAAAEAMSKILTEELRDLNITVNILLPGGAADTGFVTDELREHFKGRGLLKADVMNDAILYLASPQAEGVTGERIIGKDFVLKTAFNNRLLA